MSATPGELPLESPLGLHTGFRLQYEPAQKSHVLLFPEGMISLSDSATEIVKRCDGSRSANGIVADLEKQFPDADLRDDVLEFLNAAWSKGWITVVTGAS